jgi:hypothetical protein
MEKWLNKREWHLFRGIIYHYFTIIASKIWPDERGGFGGSDHKKRDHQFVYIINMTLLQ